MRKSAVNPLRLRCSKSEGIELLARLIADMALKRLKEKQERPK